MAPTPSFFKSAPGKVPRVYRGRGWSNGPKSLIIVTITPQKIWCRISEPWQVWMYFFGKTKRPRYTGTNMNLQPVLNTPKKAVLELIRRKIYSPNFPTQKKSLNRKFQTPKTPSIIPVTWNPKYPSWAPTSYFNYEPRTKSTGVLETLHEWSGIFFKHPLHVVKIQFEIRPKSRTLQQAF